MPLTVAEEACGSRRSALRRSDSRFIVAEPRQRLVPAGRQGRHARRCFRQSRRRGPQPPPGGQGTHRIKITPPSVSVPVLSKQTTSTRASTSTAGCSCTRILCLRPRATAAAAKAGVVISASPAESSKPLEETTAIDTCSPHMVLPTASRPPAARI